LKSAEIAERLYMHIWSVKHKIRVYVILIN
jgi:DNA-binding CsgD family transcriptional regulator